MLKKFNISLALFRKASTIPASIFFGILVNSCTQAAQNDPLPNQIGVPEQANSQAKNRLQKDIKSEDIFHYNFDEKYLEQLFSTFPEIITKLPKPSADKNALLEIKSGKIYVNKGTFRDGFCSHYFATFHSNESLKGSEGLEFGILAVNADQNRPLYIFTQGFGHGCSEAPEISPISQTFTLGSFNRMNNAGLRITVTKPQNINFEIIPK